MSKTAESRWPSYYPPGVPPEEAALATGSAYRIVSQIPTTSTDFRSTYEEQPKRDYGDQFWKACGTSFHRELADCRRVRDRYKPLRDRRIAAGPLKPDFGVMLDTPAPISPSHVTVWIRRGAAPAAAAAFTLDAEGSR